MLLEFENYSDKEIKTMVTESFNTIEKTGVWDTNTFVCKTWNNLYESNGGYLSVTDFLRELYYSYATRYNLFTNYSEYIKSSLSNS